MSILKDNRQLNHARKLRREMTPQERKLWYLFFKNYPIKCYKQRIIGHYIVDFYCASAKVVIELDGGQHYEDQGKQYDAKRSAYLNGLGLQVLRYTNLDINHHFKTVCEEIDRVIRKRMEC